MNKEETKKFEDSWKDQTFDDSFDWSSNQKKDEPYPFDYMPTVSEKPIKEIKIERQEDVGTGVL